MSSFSDGFVTGLANKLSEGIDQRRESARKYFERQLEIAQTTGVENLKKSKARANASMGYANQLVQMGVPKNVVMAQAKANPEGLSSLVEQVSELQQAYGGKLTADDFADLWNVSGAVENPDEDFATFFGRIHKPLKEAVQEDPDGFRVNPGRTLWKKMWASDAHQGAVDKLRNTEVIDGYSAADLIRMGDGAVEGDPSVTITPNYEKLGRLAADAKKAKSESEPLNTTEAAYVTKFVDEGVKDLVQKRITEMEAEGLTISEVNEIDAILQGILEEEGVAGGVFEELDPKVQRAIVKELRFKIRINKSNNNEKIPAYGESPGRSEEDAENGGEEEVAPEAPVAAPEAPKAPKAPPPTVSEGDGPEPPRIKGVNQIQPGVYDVPASGDRPRMILQWIGRSPSGYSVYKDRATGKSFELR